MRKRERESERERGRKKWEIYRAGREQLQVTGVKVGSMRGNRGDVWHNLHVTFDGSHQGTNTKQTQRKGEKRDADRRYKAH